MQKMLGRNPYIATTVSVLASVLAVSGIVYAATTIGTNVTVDGTLTQTGAATFSGAVNASSTLLVTGAVTHYGNSTFGDAGTDVNLFTGTLQASTTALFTTGLLTYGNSTFGDAAADVNLFTGTVQASTTALFTSGLTSYSTASTSALVVSGPTTLNGIIAGFCNIPDTTVTASSTDFADCAGATGVHGAGYRVFVMATGSLPTNLMIRSASSSVVTANAINVEIFNTGLAPNTNTTGNISFNFWAFR